MPKLVTWNDDLLLEKARGIALAYVDKVADETRSQLGQKTWPWGGFTKRRNGEIVGKTRNVLDTGVLRESQTVELKANGGRIIWDPPEGYAAQRFRGTGYGPNGRPADWITPVLEKYPFPVYFQREWSRFSVGRSAGQTY